jgi:hypothetical protein
MRAAQVRPACLLTTFLNADRSTAELGEGKPVFSSVQGLFGLLKQSYVGMEGSGASRDTVVKSCDLLCSAPLCYARAIAHSVLRGQPRRRRPRPNEPNENCLLRMRCARSMPAIVMVAFANSLNPAIDAQRRLMARWSCSMRLFRYLFVRTLTFRQHECSRRSSHSAEPLVCVGRSFPYETGN